MRAGFIPTHIYDLGYEVMKLTERTRTGNFVKEFSLEHVKFKVSVRNKEFRKKKFESF